MILAELPMLGPYTLTLPSGSSTAPGPSNALSDHSTATFVDVDQFIGGSGVFLNNVKGALGTGGTPVASAPLVAVYARFIGGPIANVRLLTSGAGSSSALEPGGVPRETDLGTLYPMDSRALGQVNNAINGYGVNMIVDVPADRAAHTMSRIYEAWIVVELRSSDAPPCRMIGRGDSLGVGSGRMFPPSKMQQSSSRGVGAY